MSDYLKDIPDWIKTATERKDVEDWNTVLTQRNFLAGAYVGHVGRIAELEKQLELARQYQLELDCRYLEAKGAVATGRFLREHGIG